MKSNITLKLDSSLIREAKVLAARRGLSVSRMLSEELERLLRQDKAYTAAQERAMRRLKKGLDLKWTPVRERSELHER